MARSIHRSVPAKPPPSSARQSTSQPSPAQASPLKAGSRSSASPGGLWSRYDPRMLELDYFLAHPETAWPVIREIFYDHFGAAKPNRAHEVLAAWEARGLLKVLITQNIDSVQLN